MNNERTRAIIILGTFPITLNNFLEHEGQKTPCSVSSISNLNLPSSGQLSTTTGKSFTTRTVGRWVCLLSSVAWCLDYLPIFGHLQELKFSQQYKLSRKRSRCRFVYKHFWKLVLDDVHLQPPWLGYPILVLDRLGRSSLLLYILYNHV